MESEPFTLEEKIVVWAMGLTYVNYATGALFVVGPVLGWVLVLIAAWRYTTTLLPVRPVSLTAWIWIVSSLVLLITLVVGHVDYRLSLPAIIKSVIGWGKGWALFPVFIVAGCCLQIRLRALARGATLIGMQTTILTPLMLGAWIAGLPSQLWVSPLRAVGGPGPEFFAFNLYSIGPDGGMRLSYFAPWAPGAGIVAVVLFMLSARERIWWLKVFGITGAILIAYFVKSRLVMLGLPFVACASFFLSRLTHAWVLGLGACILLVVGFIWTPLLHTIEDAIIAFENYRPDSTRVRGALQAIAKHRAAEAFWFGHGVQDKGTHIVEFMPIGSHHTWNSLLFLKGVIGQIAFAIPMVWTLIELIVRMQHQRIAVPAFATIAVMWLYSFGENLEILVYLFWPGLIAVGRACAFPRYPVTEPEAQDTGKAAA